MKTAERTAIILGVADGLTIIIGLLISLRHQQPAVFHAALGAGIAELVGMSAALWFTAERNVANFLTAMACGVATALACIIPALPFAAGWHDPLALIASLTAAAGIGGVVAWLRPEHGVIAVLETFGVLILAGALCFAASFI